MWEMGAFPFHKQPKLDRRRVMSLYDSFDYMTKQQGLIQRPPRVSTLLVVRSTAGSTDQSGVEEKALAGILRSLLRRGIWNGRGRAVFKGDAVVLQALVVGRPDFVSTRIAADDLVRIAGAPRLPTPAAALGRPHLWIRGLMWRQRPVEIQRVQEPG